MNLIGLDVVHKTYDEGTITKLDDNKMEVEFGTCIKTFVYPDSFEKFFTVEDKTAQNYINQKLEEQRAVKKQEMNQLEKKIAASSFAKKKRKNEHVVFALEANELDDAMRDGRVFVGRYLSGKSKGAPRVPQNINANSICVLTTKAKDEEEHSRAIAGIFMAAEDFIGENCRDGIVRAHQDYRIFWDEDHKKLLFWNYIGKQFQTGKWGNTGMKYLTEPTIRKIFADMIEAAQDHEEQENLREFYEYFCEMNG